VASRTRSELRRFGLTVGGVFLVLAAVSAWRGHVLPPRILGALGVLLVVPGLLFPVVLGPVERGWMAFASALGWFNTRLILGLVYYVVFTPAGLIRRLAGDPLDRRLRTGAPSHWIPREPARSDPSRYRKQF
jgi:hypothetical protein